MAKKPTVVTPKPKAEVYTERLHPDYVMQKDSWEKMEDLYVGEERVKEKTTVYLPATEIEAVEPNMNRAGSRYQFRLENAVFFNAVGRLTRYTMGQLFRVAPVMTIDLPEGLKPMLANADMMGTPLSDFMKNGSSLAYALGHAFIMVDMPSADGITNRAQQQRAAMFPYFTIIHAAELINWKYSRSPNGRIVFDWVVRRETSYESENPNEEHKKVTRFRVWYPDKWELYEASSENQGKATSKSKKSTVIIQPNSQTETTAKLISSGKNHAGVVPIVPLYAQMVRPMVSMPPLTEAGNLNLHHYHLYSSLNNGLMYHLNPILHISGVNSVEQIKIGSKSCIITPRNGEVKYAEYQGGGMKIAKEVCDSLAAEMWEAGMRSSVMMSSSVSDKSRKTSRSDFMAWMNSLAQSYETGWSQAFEIAAKWIGETIKPKDDKTPIVRLNRDFDLSALEANSAEFLLNARKAGEISRKTFLEALKRGEYLPDTLNSDDEITASKQDLEFDMEVLAKVSAMGEKSQPSEKAPPPKDKVPG